MIGRIAAAAIALLAALLPGCKGRAKAPPVPAAPVTVASAEPLSAPQVTVRLPPSQPVPPDAVPPLPEAEREGVPEPALPAPPAKPVTRPPRQTPANRPAPAPTAPPANARAATNPPLQLRPYLTADQEQDLQRRISRSLESAEKLLLRVVGSKEAVERVRSFIDQAQKAREQGDLIKAKSLAEQAELLAADLTPK